MVHSFMIYTALNRGKNGYDEISIWPFAIDHAAWLYNGLPQCMREITPFEMVSSMKSDYPDLIQAHVWGCPAYVF